jgi:hypothetical protein
MKKKVITIFVTGLFAACPTYGQEFICSADAPDRCVYPIPQGTPAPVDGLLMTPEMFEYVSEVMEGQVLQIQEERAFHEKMMEAQEAHYEKRLAAKAPQEKPADTEALIVPFCAGLLFGIMAAFVILTPRK